jgi:hypothetical protein
MGMALEAKRSGKAASPEVRKVARGMSAKQLKDFAGTKTKNLPARVRKKK